MLLIDELEKFIEEYSMYGLDTPISLSYLRSGCTPYAYGLAIHLMGLQFDKVHIIHIANTHTATLVNKCCVDIVTGVVFDKHPKNVITENLKPTHKLSNFSQKKFDLYWVDSGYVGKNLTFEVFKITPVGKHRFYP